MPRSFRSVRPFVRSQRRKTSWTVGPSSGADGESQEITASSSVLATSAIEFLFDGDTLVRTRGEFVASLVLSSAVANGYNGAFAIGLATLQAVTAGVASLPTPIDEQEWDGWLYHRYFSLISGGAIASATAAQQADQVNGTLAALRLEVDSKAMRKVKTDMALFAIIQVIETGTATMRFSFNSRTLLKLP